MSASRPPTRLICPLTANDPQAMRREMLVAARRGADAVECRLDMLSAVPSAGQLRALLAEAPLPVIATCRPRREGGHFDGEEARRLELLRAAADLGADWIDCEADTPPADRPGGRLILSRHDCTGCPADLEAQAARLDASPAAVNKIAFLAAGPDEALRAFDAARACRKPTLAIAMGEAGVLTRLLAGMFGLFGTSAALAAGAGSAPGQPTLDEFRKLYRWQAVGPATAVYGVIGWPVAHSMSPAIHNAAFAAAGLDAVYVPLPVAPGRGPFERFLEAVRRRPWLDLRGLSVTLPHKENALAYVGADACDELTRRIGAVNTLTLPPDDPPAGANTDYAAALDALCGAMDIPREGLAGRAVAVLGAGGAARAIVAALAHYGAAVTVYNRTLARAERLATEFDCQAAPADKARSTDAEIVINCTSLGMHPDAATTPLPEMPASVRVVFDTVYNPVETRLLAEAKAAGRQVVSGLEMFVNQAVAQFETWTQAPAPRDVMRKVVVDLLGA